MINIRAKGANGEREVATLLNGIVMTAMQELGFPHEKIVQAHKTVQRNSQQSAVGGSDLIHTFGLSIEVKRQEQLYINQWWAQCVDQARRNQEWPVLLYRQNHKPWRCMTYMRLPMPDGSSFGDVVGEMNYLAFQAWFKAWVIMKFRQGEAARV